MYRNIDRRKLVKAYPLYILLRHVRKGHIIALQEGKPCVIILEIQGFSHPGRHLVNKAENTFIAAMPVFVHQTRFKHNAEVLIRIFFDLALDAVIFLRGIDKECKLLIIRQISVVKNITDLSSVDTYQTVSGHDPKLLGN